MIRGIFFDWVGPLLELDSKIKDNQIAVLAGKYWQEFKDDKKVIEALANNELTRDLSESEIATAIVNRYQKITKVWELLPGLHRKYKMAVINNGMGFTVPYFKKKFQPDDYFDIFINSATEGVSKPNPEIYLLACERLSLDPKDCIFIDDSERCVASAINIGIRGILFLDPNKLISDLVGIGAVNRF